jgi:hypothetical protein
VRIDASLFRSALLGALLGAPFFRAPFFGSRFGASLFRAPLGGAPLVGRLNDDDVRVRGSLGGAVVVTASHHCQSGNAKCRRVAAES